MGGTQVDLLGTKKSVLTVPFSCRQLYTPTLLWSFQKFLSGSLGLWDCASGSLLAAAIYELHSFILNEPSIVLHCIASLGCF